MVGSNYKVAPLFVSNNGCIDYVAAVGLCVWALAAM